MCSNGISEADITGYDQTTQRFSLGARTILRLLGNLIRRVTVNRQEVRMGVHVRLADHHSLNCRPVARGGRHEWSHHDHL